MYVTGTPPGNERELRLQCPPVREVLLGAHAKINTTRFRQLLQGWNDLLDARFVRDPVVAGIRPRWLGELGDGAPELLVAQFTRQAAPDLSG